MAFLNYNRGQRPIFGDEYLELILARAAAIEKIRRPEFQRQQGHNRRSQAGSAGTNMHTLQEGIPEILQAGGCYFRWQESLTLLAQLVEAKIPN